MLSLVLLRHGESLWNKENRFTGWIDVDLTDKGLNEARNAGRILRESGFIFDLAFTSFLKKAIRTLWIVLDEMDLMWIPVIKSWRLNERHYGALQGRYKSEIADRYGEKQVLLWRRGYDTRPPPLKKTDEMYPGHDPRYQDLDEKELPVAESLADTQDRLIPFWEASIVPELLKGKRILIVAHGNSLRSLIKHLDSLSPAEILALNIPTGIPYVYQLDTQLKPLKHYFLGDPEQIKKAIMTVEKQGKRTVT